MGNKSFLSGRILLTLVFLGASIMAFAQDDYEQLHMFRIKQENDLYQYWHKSDKNFSDGLHFEQYHHIFDIKPADWFLIGFDHDNWDDFSLSLGQDIFTPTNTQDTAIDTNDRPYTGLLYFTYSKYSNRFYKGMKLNSNFYIGLQGAAAMGEEVQNGVHEAIGNETAKGWSNQLGTGLMLDYDLTFSHILPLSTHFFEANYMAKAHVGTIYNYGGVGLQFKIGHYADSYMNINGIVNKRNRGKDLVTPDKVGNMKSNKRKLIPKRIRSQSLEVQAEYLNKRQNRKFQIFLDFELWANYTLYDGTLEGSLIQFENHVHSLPTSQEQQFQLLADYSIYLQYGSFSMAFNRFIENDQVNAGQLFGFGEISISWVF